MFEAGRGSHGVPMRLATDPDMDGHFAVEEGMDYAQAALDQWRAEQKDPQPGVYPVVVNLRARDEAEAAREAAQSGTAPLP